MNIFLVSFFLLSSLTGVINHAPVVSRLSNLFVAQNVGQEKNVLATTQSTAFYEDFTPADPKVTQSPQVAANAAKVDSLKASVAGATKPNIVVIMLDDINPLDGRLWKSSITPNIYQNFIAKGLNFTNYYGETSLCCPGRVGFLTGQHTTNHGVGDLDGTKFNPKDTVASELQSSGYYTMLVGKYINFFDQIPSSKAIPPGWTKFDALHTGNGKYFNYKLISKNGSSFTEKTYGQGAADYSTDVEANFAVQRIKEAPADKPIFAYIAPTASHGPWTAAPRHVGDPKCKNVVWDAPNVYEKDVSDKPAYVQGMGLSSKSAEDLTKFCEPLLAVDEMVGRVKNALVSTGRLQNTIFVLTADNGMSWGEHRLQVKTTPYSTHLPLYVTWPAGRGITPATTDTTISNIDFAPTFCEVGGCVMGPYPNGQQKADGLSFLSLLKNQDVPWYRTAILESQPIKPVNQAAPADRPAWFAIRTTEQNPLGLWHYVEYKDGEKELYDVSHGPCYSWTPNKGGDPCELNNLIPKVGVADASTQATISALVSQLNKLKSEKGVSPVTITPTPAPTGTPSPSLTPAPTGTGTGTLSTKNTVSMILSPTEDALVRNDYPNINYGKENFLKLDGNPKTISYMKFDLTKLKGKTVKNAVITIRVTNDDGSNANLDSNPANINTVTGSWSESSVTFKNRPTSGTLITTITGQRKQNTLITIDLTSFIAKNTGKVVSLSFTSSGGGDGLNFYSREASSNKPTLTVSYN